MDECLKPVKDTRNMAAMADTIIDNIKHCGAIHRFIVINYCKQNNQNETTNFLTV